MFGIEMDSAAAINAGTALEMAGLRDTSPKSRCVAAANPGLSARIARRDPIVITTPQLDA
jgi:hypothetical protein